MARGRKKGTRKGYFYEIQEKAVIDYVKCEDEKERNRIFYETLYPAFSKMIESIINRYKLYPQDELFKETFDDTMSFLMTKIKMFNPESGYKAYSYCGTICKNYLIYKINKYAKNQKRNLSYDQNVISFDNNSNAHENPFSNKKLFLSELIESTTNNIKEILEKKEEYKLNENEEKVGKALVTIFSNWEDIFSDDNSNKFNKSSILLYIKEYTLLSTKEIRDAMKKYKTEYYSNKEKLL